MSLAHHTSENASKPLRLSSIESDFVHTVLRRMFQRHDATAERLKRLVDHAADKYEGTTLAEARPNTRKSAPRKKSVSEAAGDMRATAQAKDTMASSVFMTALGGRQLGNIRYSELDGIAANSAFEMRFAALLIQHRKPDNIQERLSVVFSAQEIAALMKKAREG